MEKTSCIVSKISDVKAITGEEGHPDIAAYPLLQVGEKGSLYLNMRLDVLEPGGGTEPHYHTDCDVFDHAFYVISGDVVMSIGGKEFSVGPDTLVYCHSSEVHAMRNVGTDKAKVLAMAAAPGGKAHGRLVVCSDSA